MFIFIVFLQQLLWLKYKKKNSFTHKWHPAAHQETDSDFNADHVQGDTNYENTGNTKDLLKYSQTLK